MKSPASNATAKKTSTFFFPQSVAMDCRSCVPSLRDSPVVATAPRGHSAHARATSTHSHASPNICKPPNVRCASNVPANWRRMNYCKRSEHWAKLPANTAATICSAPSFQPSASANSALRAFKELLVIELFYWPTPNGHKISLFLEEAGLPYKITRIDITKGDQFAPEFLAISPNNRMPAIVDHAPADTGAPI